MPERGRQTRYRVPENARQCLALEVLGLLSAVEQKYAPESLWVAGDLSLLRETRVAIVGSRDASPEGIKRAGKLAAHLASCGIVVVSGLARGIDRAAHEGAMRAGGRTIAVIGTPIDRAYPAKHADLQMEIAEEHLLVSQFAPSQQTFPSHFVERNRTMALLSNASVVVEANDGSGSLSQASETQRLGRPLFFMQSVLENKALEWPRRFQASGALALHDSPQIIEALAAQHAKLAAAG